MLLTYNINRTGPRTERWGIPILMFKKSEYNTLPLVLIVISGIFTK